jgi:methylenetetrahydrofolate reductase (NADPH)
VIRALELTPTADGTAHPDWDALLALQPELIFVSEPPGLDNDAALRQLRGRTRVPLVPHLTTRNRTPHDVAARVGAWRGLGLDQLFALRGDAVTACDLARDTRLRSGAELTRLLLALDPELAVWVAAYPEGHPEAVSPDADLHALTAKVAAGATGLVTQACYDAEVLLRFRDRCYAAGLGVPLLAGLLPLDEPEWLLPFCRDAHIALPGPTRALLEHHADDAVALAEAGAEHLAALVARLAREDLDGWVLFSRNRATAGCALWRALA